METCIIKKKEPSLITRVRFYKCSYCHSTYIADITGTGSDEITHCPVCKGCYNKPDKFSKLKVWFFRLIGKIH